MMGETIPKESNQVSLHENLEDPWGIPQLKVDVDYDENDEKMLQDFFDEWNQGKKEKDGYSREDFKIVTADSPPHPE